MVAANTVENVTFDAKYVHCATSPILMAGTLVFADSIQGAQCSLFGPAIDSDSTIFDLTVNDALVNWGLYNSDHTYTYTLQMSSLSGGGLTFALKFPTSRRRYVAPTITGSLSTTLYIVTPHPAAATSDGYSNQTTLILAITLGVGLPCCFLLIFVLVARRRKTVRIAKSLSPTPTDSSSKGFYAFDQFTDINVADIPKVLSLAEKLNQIAIPNEFNITTSASPRQEALVVWDDSFPVFEDHSEDAYTLATNNEPDEDDAPRNLFSRVSIALRNTESIKVAEPTDNFGPITTKNIATVETNTASSTSVPVIEPKSFIFYEPPPVEIPIGKTELMNRRQSFLEPEPSVEVSRAYVDVTVGKDSLLRRKSVFEVPMSFSKTDSTPKKFNSFGTPLVRTPSGKSSGMFPR